MTSTPQPALRRCVDVGGAYLSAETRRTAIVVAVTGEVDALNADFTATVLNGFADGATPIVVDLSGLDFIGTDGLCMLVDFDDRCQANNVAWALLPCRMLLRLLQAVQINRYLPVSASVDAAVQQLQAHSSLPARRALPHVAGEKLRC